MSAISHYSANNISESWSGSKDEKVETRGGVGAAAKLEWMKLKSGGRGRGRRRRALRRKEPDTKWNDFTLL